VGCKGGAAIAFEIRAERKAPELVLVQIAKEARKIRGGSQTVSRQGLFLAVVVRAFFGDYGVVLSSRTAVYKLNILEKMMCS